MPQLSAYTSMLRGALASASSTTVSRQQLRTPRLWLTAFCAENLKVLERNCRRTAPYSTVITFDGSLTGGGATLQIGIRKRHEISFKPIMAYWADRWSDDDLKLINATPGDPAAQAKCEALTLLASIATWRPILLAAQGSLTIVGDAPGVLHDA